jgi:hypothetical protein
VVTEEAQADTILFIKYRCFAQLAVKLTGSSSSLQQRNQLFQPLHERIVDQIPCLDLGKTRIDPVQSIDHVLNSAHPTWTRIRQELIPHSFAVPKRICRPMTRTTDGEQLLGFNLLDKNARRRAR